jgi:hypothetical protein
MEDNLREASQAARGISGYFAEAQARDCLPVIERLGLQERTTLKSVHEELMIVEMRFDGQIVITRRSMLAEPRVAPQ